MSEYRTRNLGFASFILARDSAQIPEIRGETGRAEFVFDDREEKLGWEWELFQADTPVPVLQFVWAQRELRAQMARAFGQRDELTTVTTGRAAHQALRSK